MKLKMNKELLDYYQGAVDMAFEIHMENYEHNPRKTRDFEDYDISLIVRYENNKYILCCSCATDYDYEEETNSYIPNEYNQKYTIKEKNTISMIMENLDDFFQVATDICLLTNRG